MPGDPDREGCNGTETKEDDSCGRSHGWNTTLILRRPGFQQIDFVAEDAGPVDDQNSNSSASFLNLGIFLAFREAEAKNPIEIVGKELRAQMPLLDPVTVEEVARKR